MEPEEMLERFTKCHRELEKVNPDPKITGCRTCPLGKDVTLSIEADGLPLSAVQLKISPCGVIAELAEKIKSTK